MSGALTWALEEGEEGTTITTTYAVHGYAADGLTAWAEAVDGVVRQQVERLARYLETGDPAGAVPAADDETGG